MTGSATRPSGVFRAHAGYLIVTSATHNVIRGRFEVAADEGDRHVHRHA